MRTSAPPLLPLLRSQVQGDLLALTHLHPDREYSLTEAASHIGASVKAVQHEASRLVAAGLLADRRVGKARLIRIGPPSPLSGPLTELLIVTYGPLPVLSDLLADAAGIDRAFIYGSWAARYQGEEGPPPHDVDVLVIGTAGREQLDDLALEAEATLGRPVSIRRVSRKVWDEPPAGDAFLASVRARPLVELRRKAGG